MSKLFQIIGRAIRNCTHQTLPESERTVTPILYLSEDNEKKYNEAILINRSNVPFLDILKESTIDCLLNKQMASNVKCFIDGETNLPKPIWYGYDILGPMDSRMEYIQYLANLQSNPQFLINAMNTAIANAEPPAENVDEGEGEEIFVSKNAGKIKKTTRTKLKKHGKKKSRKIKRIRIKNKESNIPILGNI